LKTQNGVVFGIETFIQHIFALCRSPATPTISTSQPRAVLARPGISVGNSRAAARYYYFLLLFLFRRPDRLRSVPVFVSINIILNCSQQFSQQ